jgi:hypothetical protein
MRWCRDVNTRSGCSLACSAIHCCFVYVLVELRVSSSVSHQWVCSGDAPLPSSGSRWPRFPAFSGTIKALRLPALACPSAYWFRQPAPRAPAGGSCPPWALPPSCRPDGGPGSGLFALAVPFQRSCPRARAGSPRFPGDPSRDFAAVHDPGRPVAPRRWRRFRYCPRPVNTEGVVGLRFRGLPRRFITCCLRFTTGVAARHARLASGWRAAPLPGGSRTRWIATRGFSSCHPPLQGLPWRNNRSSAGGSKGRRLILLW